MGHISPHHLESDLLLPHDLKPVDTEHVSSSRSEAKQGEYLNCIHCEKKVLKDDTCTYFGL